MCAATCSRKPPRLNDRRRRGLRRVAVLVDEILLPGVVAILLDALGLLLLAARRGALRQRLLRHVRHVPPLLFLLLVLLQLVADLLLAHVLLELRSRGRRLRRGRGGERGQAGQQAASQDSTRFSAVQTCNGHGVGRSWTGIRIVGVPA